MNEPDVMVYLMTGFLDSGKSQFLKFTLTQDYFQIDGTTLLILCEEGEEEFDPLEMAKHGDEDHQNRRIGRVDRSILK